MRSPSRITVTPGIFSAADVSALASTAPCAGGLRIRACRAPAGAISPAYFALPVTFSIASRRGADVPTMVKAFTGFTAGFDASVRSMRLPSVSWPYVTFFAAPPAAVTTPSFTESDSTGAWSRSAAIASRTPRASAAASRRTGPNDLMLSEPNVPMSHGQRSVSPHTISTDASATSRSSASNCGSDVIAPCPSSTLPTKQVTLLSAPMWR